MNGSETQSLSGYQKIATGSTNHSFKFMYSLKSLLVQRFYINYFHTCRAESLGRLLGHIYKHVCHAHIGSVLSSRFLFLSLIAESDCE